MFSKRTPHRFDLNPLSRALEATPRPGLLNLTVSNPARAGLIPAADILPLLSGPDNLHYEPDPHGLPKARHALARHLAGRGHAIDPERIFLTASTSEAYGYLFKLLCDPGDAVLVPEPSYPLLDHLIELECAVRVPYELVYEKGWKIDFDSVEAALATDEGQKAKAIVVVSPNNPTGNYLKAAELEQLARLAGERGLAIIADEVFEDYLLDPVSGSAGPAAASAFAARHALTFSLGGLSKTLGLPQLKLSWILASGPEPAISSCLERLELIADTYLSVGTPVQTALEGLLGLLPRLQTPIRERVRANLDLLRRMTGSCETAGLLAAEGGWYAMLKIHIPCDDEALALELLEKDHVLVQPGYFYDCTGGQYLVISLLTPEATLQDGTARILSRLSAA